MRPFLALMLTALTSLGSAVAAQESTRAVVVELYTSQGCSSCPPADELLGKLTKRDDVIPLALHVDYWDYIGWKDAFADPEHTVRQRKYARAWKQRTIYTPQMVIGGLHPVVGNRPMDVATLIQKHAMSQARVSLEVTRAGDTLTINATPLAKVSASVVHVVRYSPMQTVDIRRGENAGRKLTYHNVVTDWQTVGDWNGASAMTMTETVSGSDPVVVIVQESGYGVVLAAARLR